MKDVTLKSLLIIGMIAFGSSVVHAGSKKTARYVKANAEIFLNKSVSLDVSHVTPMKSPSIEGVKWFLVHTYDRAGRSYGGTIMVATTSERSQRFQRSHGLTATRLGGPRGGVATDHFRGSLETFASGVPFIAENDEASRLVAQAPSLKNTAEEAMQELAAEASSRIRSILKRTRRN